MTEDEAEEKAEAFEAQGRFGMAPGTMVLIAVFLLAFIVYYFANWKLLSVLWRIG